MSAEQETYVNITLTRASFGEAENVYALIDGREGPFIAYVPRKNIDIDKQKVGSELTAKLNVKIIESGAEWDVVEIETDPGEKHKFRVDKKTHQLVPLRMKPVYYDRFSS